MKVKRKYIYVCVAFPLLIWLSGCRGTPDVAFSPISTPISLVNITGRNQSPQPTENTSSNVVVMTNGFEPLGIIFVDSDTTGIKGYEATHNHLLRTAVNKGADAIVNVKIYSTGFFRKKWYGSALAVKYLNTVPTVLIIHQEKGE
jgi:hypothetical protein